MTRITSTYLAIFALLLSPMAANADVIASQELDFDVPASGWTSASGTQQIAEDFFVSDPSTANELTWWGRTGGGAFSFDILFFMDNAGLPDATAFYSFTTAILGGTFVGNDPDDGQSTSIWNTAIPDAVLAEGMYWISIRSSIGQPEFVWQHATASGSAVVFRSGNDGAWGTSEQGERSANAFVIEGRVAVPEPGTLALLGIGLFGMGLARRRRKV